jgi:hypothetical protein
MKLDRETAPEMWRLNLARFVPASLGRASVDLGWSVPKDSSPHDAASFGYFSLPERKKEPGKGEGE